MEGHECCLFVQTGNFWLDNDRFNDSDEYASYLNNYNSPEDLFESLIYERDNIDNVLLKIFSFLALFTSISGVALFFKKSWNFL